MVQDTPSRKLDQYIVRFPDGMRDRIKAAADANGRSMNAEIVARLEASLSAQAEAPEWTKGVLRTMADFTRDVAEIRKHIRETGRKDD